MPVGRWWLLVAGMGAIGAVPWLLAAAGADSGFLFAFLCHQAPDRTLHLNGEPMALCSRCAGVHLGLMLGALAALPRGGHAFWMRHGRALVIGAIGLNLLDWAVFHVVPLSHVSRIAVGACFGASATAFMLAALSPKTARPPQLEPLGSR